MYIDRGKWNFRSEASTRYLFGEGKICEGSMATKKK